VHDTPGMTIDTKQECLLPFAGTSDRLRPSGRVPSGAGIAGLQGDEIVTSPICGGEGAKSASHA